MNLSYLVCPLSSAKLSLLMNGSQISSYTPTIPPGSNLPKTFFSFLFILISEFGVIQSGSQSPERTSLTHFKYLTAPPRTWVCRRPLEKRYLYPDTGISCSTNTWNVAALCYTVFVVQFVTQVRLICNCICMITRLCMQSQANTFESSCLIKQHMYSYILYSTYMLVLHHCPMCFFDAGQKKNYRREEQHHDK